MFSAWANLWFELVGAASVILLAIYQYKATECLPNVSHDPNEGVWRVHYSDKPETTGKLICAGYRSAYLVILVLQQQDSRYHYCRVWQDQINGEDFSYIHHQMLFNTAAPIRRPLKALFPDR